MKKMCSPGPFFFVLYKVAPNVLLVVYLIMRKVLYQLIHCCGISFSLFSFHLFQNIKERKIRKKQRQPSKLLNCIEFVIQTQISCSDFSHGVRRGCAKLHSGQLTKYTKIFKDTVSYKREVLIILYVYITPK